MNILFIIIIIIIILFYFINDKLIQNDNDFLNNKLNQNNKLNSNDFLNNKLTDKLIHNDNDFLNDKLNQNDKLNNPNKINYNNNTFKFIGTANNNYHNQKFFLYELIKTNHDSLNKKIYYYIFVVFDNEQYIIQQEFGPRTKINIGDIIYLLNGINQIGPYIIIK